MEAVENCLERCADIKVDFEALERLIEPEEEKVCLRSILKYSTRRGSDIFQFFDTSEKKTSRGKQRALVGAPKREREREGGYAGKVAK